MDWVGGGAPGQGSGDWVSPDNSEDFILILTMPLRKSHWDILILMAPVENISRWTATGSLNTELKTMLPSIEISAGIVEQFKEFFNAENFISSTLQSLKHPMDSFSYTFRISITETKNSVYTSLNKAAYVARKSIKSLNILLSVHKNLHHIVCWTMELHRQQLAEYPHPYKLLFVENEPFTVLIVQRRLTMR